jgi:hypothetical protein
MVRVVRADQQDGRRLAWVGRSGVELLDLGEHLQYEHESLGRYSRGSDGAIEWSVVADGLVLCSMDSDSIELSNVIQEYAQSAGSLVFFWESLAIPSVKMESESAVSHLSSIMESMPEFWVYSPSDRVVLENSFSGVVTVAHVPADSDDPSSA